MGNSNSNRNNDTPEDFNEFMGDLNRNVIRPVARAINHVSNMFENSPQQTEEELYREAMHRQYGHPNPYSHSSTSTNDNGEPEDIVIKEQLLFNIDVTRQSECSICLDDFVPGDVGTILCCGHNFHCGCISEWLKDNDSCPNCRSRNVMQKRSKEKFVDKQIVDMTLLDNINIKKMRVLLKSFNIDCTLCIEKSDMISLINKDIFYRDHDTKSIKEYLSQYGIDTSQYVDRTNLLNIVAFIRLTTRF